MSYLKRTYSAQSSSSSSRTLQEAKELVKSRSRVQIFHPVMRANRFMVISFFFVYTLLLYSAGLASHVLFIFGGILDDEIPSPCYLFTATEVIRTVLLKNVRCCGFLCFLGSGKPVRASPLFCLFVNRLEIRGLHLDEQPSKKER